MIIVQPKITLLFPSVLTLLTSFFITCPQARVQHSTCLYFPGEGLAIPVSNFSFFFLSSLSWQISKLAQWEGSRKLLLEAETIMCILRLETFPAFPSYVRKGLTEGNKLTYTVTIHLTDLDDSKSGQLCCRSQCPCLGLIFSLHSHFHILYNTLRLLHNCRIV